MIYDQVSNQLAVLQDRAARGFQGAPASTEGTDVPMRPPYAAAAALPGPQV